MKTKHFFYALLFGSIVVFASCSRMAEPELFTSFVGHSFNDVLTSLDEGTGDTLFLGTENGKVIFYDTETASSHQQNVGSDMVYVAREYALPDSERAMFVGVRNEGVKMYEGCRFDSAPHLFTYGKKGKNYSVYRVEKHGHFLYCATSNGIARLDMSNIGDSLTLVYPLLDEVPDDYKIGAMRIIGDSLYFSHKDTVFTYDLKGDSLHHSAKQQATIRNLFVQKGVSQPVIICDTLIKAPSGEYKNEHKVHSGIYNPNNGKYYLMAKDRFLVGSCPGTDSVYRLTLDNEQYISTSDLIIKDGFTYLIAGSNLCKIPDHLFQEQGKRITSMAKANGITYAISDLQRVYVKKSPKEWKNSFTIGGNIHNNATKAMMIQNKLCLHTGSDVFLQAGQNGGISLRDTARIVKDEDISHIYYNEASNRLFFAWRSGYAYGPMMYDGMIDVQRMKTDTILSVQCFLQPKNNTRLLYIGTLNDGCVVKDLKTGSVDKRFTHLTNIIDIALTEKDLFVLTPVYLYRADKDSHVLEDSINIRNEHICRIYTIDKDSTILGISRLGGLCKIPQDKLHDAKMLYSDILFYPEAIDIQEEKGVINAGTNTGLLELSLADLSFTPLALTEKSYVRFINFIRTQTQSFIRLGFIAVLILLLLIAVLVWWSVKRAKIVAELVETNNALNATNDKLRTDKDNLSMEVAELVETNNTLSATNDKLRMDKDNLGMEISRLELEKSQLEEDKEELKEEIEKFITGHALAKKNVLADYLFKNEWNIGSDTILNKIFHYQSFIDYQKKKSEFESQIKKLEVISYNFYEELEHQAQAARKELFPHVLRLDAYALREWAFIYKSELMDGADWAVSIFRQQISHIVNTYLVKAIHFTDQRLQETQEIFMDIWASSLLLQTPTVPEDLPTLAQEQEDKDKAMAKLVKPQCMYHLLVGKDYHYISEDNFNQKKTVLKRDFLDFLRLKETKYDFEVAFVCENEFLTSALKKLFKMEQ